MIEELRRIAHELRTYNPAADEYKGEHIHKVWAREIEAVLASINVPHGEQTKLEFMPVDSMQHAIVYGSKEAIGALKARMERDYRAASTSANAGHASLMGIVADGDGNILNATVKYREVETFMAPIAETSSNVAQGAEAQSGEPVAMDDDELAEFRQTAEDFEENGETSTPYDILMNWAERGFLDCTHFELTAEGRALLGEPVEVVHFASPKNLADPAKD